MSTEESDGGEDNFETLRTCLKKPCTNLLRFILKSKFRRYEKLKEVIPWGDICEETKSALQEQNTIRRLKFPLLGKIFCLGVCDDFFGQPVIGWSSREEIPEDDIGIAADILRIWRLWQEHIENNRDETVSDNDSNEAFNVLMDVGNRMSRRQDFADCGREFHQQICLTRKGNYEGAHADAIQAGDNNTVEMNIDASFKGIVNVVQGGNRNKFIFYSFNNRIEYQSTGYAQVTAVLQSDNPSFQALTESASNLNIEEVNELPALKDNEISIQEIKRGSLVIIFTIKNEDTLEKNLKRILDCIFKEEKIEELLGSLESNCLTVQGYIYDPQEYYLDYAPKEYTHKYAAKCHLYSHLTWKFSDCTSCDVDVILTDLFFNLLAYDFTTEENDYIWIMIKGSIIDPEDIPFSSIECMLVENVDDKIEKFNSDLGISGHCEIKSINHTKSTTLVILKTKTCLSYSELLADEGIILSFMKSFFCFGESEDFSKVQLMRVGLIIDTKLAQNGTDNALIIKFQPESNITRAIDNDILPQILTSMLESSLESGVVMPDKMKIKVDINRTIPSQDATIEKEAVIETQSQKVRKEEKKLQFNKSTNVHVYEPTFLKHDSSEEDSALDSDDDYANVPHKLISYRDPEYDQIHSDSTDSGVDLFTDKHSLRDHSKGRTDILSEMNTELVINGLELSEKCENEFRPQRKNMFTYKENLPVKKLEQLLKDNPAKYKRCSLSIESAHKAVCTNLNFADEVKEIHISGRSKCGKSYADDEVVVEILGESKIRKSERKRRYIESQTKDMNVYGKVLGTVQRNRYKTMKHPVLVCAFDDFGKHMVKPLCKTVPKIQASHKSYSSRTEFDLFTYDKQNKTLTYKNALNIHRAKRKLYCFLVAIMHWDDMYPFGVILKSIDTGNDSQSGIDILRLQYQIPDNFTDVATRVASHLQQKEANRLARTKSKGVTPVFTISLDNDSKEIAYSVEKISHDQYRIGIHIVDPTRFIKKNDILDKEIRKRGASFVINKNVQSFMIPRQVCDIIEFKMGGERNAITLSFTTNSQSIVDDESFTLRKSVVMSQKAYDLDDVTDILEGTQDFKIKVLLNVAKNIRKERLNNGTHFHELDAKLEDDGTFMKHKDVRNVIHELMIFTNLKISEHLRRKYHTIMPYRCHGAPSIDVVTLWNESHPGMGDMLCRLQDLKVAPDTGIYCSIFNFEQPFSYRHSLPFQKVVWETLKEHVDKGQWYEVGHILGMDEIHPWQSLALEDWINIQSIAEYRCLSHKHDPLLHYALRSDHYMSFTSPLNLYIDLVAHRLIDDFLSERKDCSYGSQEMGSICSEMNDVLLRKKKFYNGCQILLSGHQLHMQPQVFNGFVHEVSNTDICLCYPSLRKLPQVSKRIPLNILQTKERPGFEENRIHKREILTMRWQRRLYSVKRKSPRHREDDASVRLNPHADMIFQQKQQWINMLQSYFNGKTKNVKKEMNDEDKINLIRTVEEARDTVDDVSSEDSLGVNSNQTCHFSLSFNYGQIVVVQIAGEPEHGMMMPMPQLLDLTNNVKLCLQHARNPVNVLSEFASKSSKESYASCKEYVKVWIPILSMEIATLSVEDESFTITDLPITFSKRGGSFLLKNSFCEQRDISFTVHSTDLLGYSDMEEVEKDSEVQPFYISGSDYLCIRCELKTGLGTKSKFLNGAISPPKRYWVGHAKIDDVQKIKAPEKKIKVKFVCHKRSTAIPPGLFGEQLCNVEIIPKIEVHRRTDMYLKSLERSSDLAKAIAERRSIPTLDREHISAGKLYYRDADNQLVLKLNDNQKKAIQRAVSSSFSLIQGPPGTGKTFTGVALINIYCSINQRLRESGGKRKTVLFCGPSNKSVDLVTGYLKNSTFSRKFKILRMYGRALECTEFPIPGKSFSKRRLNKESNPDENLRDVTLHHIIREEGKTFAEEIKTFDEKFKSNPKTIDLKEIKRYKKCVGKAIKEELPKYDVILCTTSVATSATLLDAAKGSIFQVVIDEAGMCTEPECMAVIIATNAKQVVLIGDHQQLQPVVICEEAAELGLQKSLFERYAETKSSLLTFLRLQYRMNPSLCEFPSKTFYEGKLETKESPKWVTRKPLKLWKNTEYPYVFCHTDGEEEYLSYTTEEGNEMSRYNSKEIDHVVSAFRYLVKTEKISWECINIMSQYNAQCHQIRLGLKKHKFDFFNVNTVVASQGGEWDYVVFSLVRSLPEYRIEPLPTFGWCKENLGFITDAHQINVALTRARKGLIIIGNQNLMACEKLVLDPMLSQFRRHGCIVNASDLFPKIKN